jgi:pimeloyl-ACP methyl ester carboxylesterase
VYLSRVLTALCMFAALLLFSAQPAGARATFDQNPVLFVHGIEGSGSQFESQKMRFMSNGYPEAWIDAVDYNSTRAVGDKSEVDAQIDAKIAALKQKTGKSKVDVIAHSLGTSVMYDYLTNGSDAAQRRANVGHYVNVDGQQSNPGVPTLAVWAGRGTPGRKMDGATNVTIPNQTHVQTCTSAQSFVEYFKFLTGRAPAHDIVPQKGAIDLGGRVLNFPENTGLSGATVQLWKVDANGARIGSAPVHSVTVGDSGDFGPLSAETGQRYEFALVRAAHPTHHLYYEPFVRSDYMIRLLESDAISAYTGNRPGTSGAVIIRYKELWGDQGSQSDVLKVNGLSICTPDLCPITKQVNAFFAYDRNGDHQSDLSKDPVLSGLPFITGADVYVPGATPPNAPVTYELLSRGAGPARTLKVPNWESGQHTITIQWNDFEHVDAVLPGGPTIRRCAPFMTFRIPQPRHGRVVRVRAYVDGKLVKRASGHRVRRVTLKPPAGKVNFTVRLVSFTSTGKRIVSVRKYRGCSKTRPHRV